MAVATKTKGGAEVLDTPSNDGEIFVSMEVPYIAQVRIEGVSAILFHRWSNESVAAKAAAAKNSRAKKSDDVESYVWRDLAGDICIPGTYLRGAIIEAARYRQDPRSTRKSARDLFKAGVISLTELASLGKATWDYLDEQRVLVQRNAITRSRPAFHAGWIAEFEIQVVLPEYIPPADLLTVLTSAGRLVGLADFRPTYGRFQVTRFEVQAT
jgi:hypothetical protein